MFGHVDRPLHWARHLLALRDLQARSGGITEFVPLPFVPMNTPMFKRHASRNGPTWRETVLMYAVSRLVLHPRLSLSRLDAIAPVRPLGDCRDSSKAAVTVDAAVTARRLRRCHWKP